MRRTSSGNGFEAGFIPGEKADAILASSLALIPVVILISASSAPRRVPADGISVAMPSASETTVDLVVPTTTGKG